VVATLNSASLLAAFLVYVGLALRRRVIADPSTDTPAPPVMQHTKLSRGRGAARCLSVLLALAFVATGGLWLGRRAVLKEAGQLLVNEDPLGPVEVIAVSRASTVSDAIEAAQLYREGFGTEVVVARWHLEPLVTMVRALGIPYIVSTELATQILEHSGVPASAVLVLPDAVDGTDTEIRAVASFARARHPASFLFITARSHTGRARWLLQRQLPPTIRLSVRAPRTDTFQASSWWHDRDQSREVLLEYLRWVNTIILGDLWHDASATP
jgi:uncharacterized SAM-binding protein YcdF (DUF218 family)